jgi:hypothetical protein
MWLENGELKKKPVYNGNKNMYEKINEKETSTPQYDIK